VKGTFVLKINLDDIEMQDQHDVARALRGVGEYLNKLTSRRFGPYGLAGDVHDINGKTVGTWEVKGPHDDKDE
jgi:hypothetical protein